MATAPDPIRPSSFGPSAVATPANAITMARLLITPLFLVMVVRDGATWGSLLAWILLAGTDGIDGYLARRQGTTSSGAFLDPLADKFLVLGALVALVAKGVFWWLPVAVIAVREVAMSVYRSWQGRRGVSIPARFGAKVKTVVQEIAVGFALLPWTVESPWVATAWLWAGVVLAVGTGAQYLLDASKAGKGSHAV